LKQTREALRLEPDNEDSYSNPGNSYANLNRLDEAEAVYKQAEQRKLEGDDVLANRYQLAFLKGDTAKMTQVAATATGKPGAEQAAGRASGHGGLVWEVEERARADSGRDGVRRASLEVHWGPNFGFPLLLEEG
jgi:tetratricopeptide (TPR) repeat protein